MPEGPEIRRAANRVERSIRGKRLEEVYFHFDRLKAFEAELLGQRVTAVDTHGKAMITRFSGDLCLYSHNQLYGRWVVRRSGADPKTNRSLRVALRSASHSALLYSASDVDVLDADGLAAHPFLRGLGPDALWPSVEWREIDQRLRSKSFAGRQLAGVLLDQGFVAGLGNYLRAEILFEAGVLPHVRARDLDRPTRQRLARRVLSLPRRSVETGGVTLPSVEARRVEQRRGKGDRRRRFWVFAQAGRPCLRCGETIQRGTAAGRRIYWCPSCQSA